MVIYLLIILLPLVSIVNCYRHQSPIDVYKAKLSYSKFIPNRISLEALKDNADDDIPNISTEKIAVIIDDDGQLKVSSNVELLKFVVPTLVTGLLQPILSLIDTSVVGMVESSTIVELAALGPGIASIDSTS